MNESGKDVPACSLDASVLINSTTVIYGSPNTGKSVAILDSLYKIKDEVPSIIVVSPTNDSNKAYSNIVPNQLIHKNLSCGDTSKKGKYKLLTMIIERQKYMSELLTMTKDAKILYSLFKLMSPKNKMLCQKCIDKVNITVEECKSEISKQYKENEQELELEKLKDQATQKIVEIFKCFVKKDRDYLWELELDEKQRLVVNYIDINPKMVLVLDDCAAELKPAFKIEEFREIFYNHRHINITMIISCQDDTDLPANLRKTARISVFTESSVFSTYIERGGKFNKEHKIYARAASDQIFREKFRKLVLARGGSNPKDIYYYTFELRKSFKYCPDIILELCEAVKNTTDLKLDSSSQFHKNFKLN